MQGSIIFTRSFINLPTCIFGVCSTKMPFTPYARQLMVAGSPQLAAFAVGGAVTYPSVLLQQLQSNDSSIQLDLETASWIGSIHGLAGIPSILMPTIMQWKGRKFAFIAACIISIIGWITAYIASSAAGILISESFHGLGTHCLLSVSLLSMSEMIGPELRNISMVTFYVIQAFGIASVGILAKFLHWKTISLVMCLSMTLAMTIAFMWPESPPWLAYQGQFEKCERAFVWLRGTDDSAKKELSELISAQKKNLSTAKKEPTLMSYLKIVTKRDFYLPSLFMFLLMNLMYWSGTLVILIYSPDIIEKATGNKNMAGLVGVILNCILFLGIITTTVLLRYFSNKSVLLWSSFGTALALISASIVTFLQSVKILPRDSLSCLYCLIAYMIANSLGVNSIIFSMSAELMPVKHRGPGGGLYVVFTCILHTTSLKFSPYLFNYIYLWRTFMIYAGNAVVCGVLIWIYVPETKGRTLQEIEDFYKDLCFVIGNRPSKYRKAFKEPDSEEIGMKLMM